MILRQVGDEGKMVSLKESTPVYDHDRTPAHKDHLETAFSLLAHMETGFVESYTQLRLGKAIRISSMCR